METINSTTHPVVDAYINYQFNRDCFKRELSFSQALKHANHMTISYKIFIDAAKEFYSQPQNLN
jgi:hypothetical protein